MFWPYIWAVFSLRSNFLGAAIEDVWGVFWALGLGGGEGEGGGGRDLVCFNNGYNDLGLLQVDYH